MFNFLHNFLPQPILLQLGPLSIRYYGVLIFLALLAGILLASKLAEKIKISRDEVIDLALGLALVGIIGARLYFVLILETGYFLQNPAEIIKIWQGGLAIHGAIIGGIAFLIYWCRKNKKDFWQLADLIAVVLPLAQAIGRFGNYFNQELFGRPTTLPWGIPIDRSNRPLEFVNSTYFHPTFLYEAILNLILFFILFFTYRYHKFSKGWYLGVYLIGYGLIRFVMEFLRIDETALMFGWRWPQVFSIIMIVVAGIILSILLKNKKSLK